MITVIGGGLAGTEAAYQIAKRGIKVRLFEQRPKNYTPAHKSADLAELVCSNSLKSTELTNAHGQLKEELKILDSVILRFAYKNQIPGGKALVVDREAFARDITDFITNFPNIEVIREIVKEIPDGIVILTSGPLTTEDLAKNIATFFGEENLYFYDAISPIIAYDSIDKEKIFFASRYGKGRDYLNCPMTKEEYENFYSALITAETFPLHPFEEEKYFEGCLPIEEMAKRGKETLLFGPMKPVGLIDPKTQKRPYACVQLRRENVEGTMFNIVGFQTKLKIKEQKRVFRMIPGLEKAEFLRYGSVHRNTFINSPKCLCPTLQAKKNKNLFVAGQLTGVEGYVESTAMGLVAGINAVRLFKGEKPLIFPEETMIGALIKYITTPKQNFQPINANFGLLPFGFKEQWSENLLRISRRLTG